MNIYSKNLKKELNLEMYEVETESGATKTMITSCSLLKLFNSMEDVTREFPVQQMSKDYSYARCIIKTPFGEFDDDGDANAEFESDIDRHHIGMCASRRAFDRAFINALNLETSSDGRIHSSSEGIKGKKIEAAKEPEVVEEYRIGESEAVEEPEVAKESETVEEPESVEPESVDYAAHVITTNCAQKGKTIGELYDAGKKGFLMNLYKIIKANPKAKEETDALAGFFDTVGIKVA